MTLVTPVTEVDQGDRLQKPDLRSSSTVQPLDHHGWFVGGDGATRDRLFRMEQAGSRSRLPREGLQVALSDPLRRVFSSMSLVSLSQHPDSFANRHIGPRPEEWDAMAQASGHASLDALVSAAVPALIRRSDSMCLPEPLGETAALARLRGIAAKNQVFKSHIGMGYYDTITPPVIQRNILKIRDGIRSTRRIRRRFPKGVWKGC